jgi:hypothetical protein
MRITTAVFSLGLASQVAGLTPLYLEGFGQPTTSVNGVGASSLHLSVSTTSTTALSSASIAAPVPSLTRRSALPECLKTVELSCLNLAANCISHVTSDVRRDNFPA